MTDKGIPEFLLHRYDDGQDGSDVDRRAKADVDLEDGNGMRFEDDLFTLTSYSLFTMNMKGGQFELNRLVQLSTRKWLELNNELEKWKMKYLRILSEVFPVGNFEGRTICKVLLRTPKYS